MNTVLEVREPSARNLTTSQPDALQQLDSLSTAPGGVARLRELIRALAVQGRLLGQSEPRSADLPPDWTWKRLGDLVASSEAGWSPSCPEQPRREGRWGILKVSAVSWGEFDAAANKELPLELQPRPQYEVQHGDFLLSRANTAELVARSVVVKNPPPRLLLSDKIIRLKLKQEVDAEYLNLVNNSSAARSHYQALASGTSASMKNVSREVVLALPVPLPPLAEQTRIVTRVDELMRLCDALEEKGRLEAEQHARLLSTLLGTLTDSATPEELAANWQRVAEHFDLLLDRPEAVDALEQTVLRLAVLGLLGPQDPSEGSAQNLLGPDAKARHDSNAEAPQLPDGWAWAYLGEVADARLGKMLDKAKNRGRPRPYLRNTNVQWQRFELDDVKHMNLDESELEEFRLRSGDLLICEGGEPGRCAIWQENETEMYFQKALHRVRPHAGVMAQYIAIALEADALSGALSRYFTGATIKHFVGQALDRYSFPLPPSGEQQRIVARVAELRRLCATLRQRLQAQQATQSRLAEALVEQALSG